MSAVREANTLTATGGGGVGGGVRQVFSSAGSHAVTVRSSGKSR